jgi:WD40 repeat protein
MKAYGLLLLLSGVLVGFVLAARRCEAQQMPRATLRGLTHWVTCVAFSPDGKTLASGSDEGETRLWQVASGAEQAVYRAPNQEVCSVAFTPDGRTLAAAGAAREWKLGDDDGLGVVRLWDTATGKERARLLADDLVNSVAVTPDGKMLALACMNSTVEIWDISPQKLRCKLRGHAKSATSVAFSPDGKVLASGSQDRTIKLWDVAGAKELTTFRKQGDGYAHRVAFSPDGRTLASGGDGGAVLWDVAAGKERSRLKGKTTGVWCLAFAADGKTLALGGYEDRGRVRMGDLSGRVLVPTVSLWDVPTLTESATIACHDYPVTAVAFTPDGKVLATASWDGLVKLWEVAKLMAPTPSK